jgi:uncharacterized protein with ParB-like and HNH nuclease domain/predicted transport protein
MQARQARFLEVIEKAPQFQIPLYQRMYSWTERECRQLWDDIVRAGENESIKVHFIGSVVYVEKEMSGITHKSPVLVIDGQQRLTTVTLLLAALAHVIGDNEPLDGFSAVKIKSYYLVNDKESDERYYKLILSQTDRDSLKALIDNKELPREHSIRIKENYDLFSKWLGDKKTDLATICRGVAKLMIVDIALTREQDNPQLIFESMNSTGKVLSQADLIRNYILMGLEIDLQTRLYNDYWRRMEVDFGQEAYSTHFDGFMRHFLTVKTGEIPNIGEVYEAFKLYSRSTKKPEETESQHIENIVKDIHRFGSHFCQFALGQETDTELKQAFHDIRELKVDVVYPFLLELYRDYEDGVLAKDDFVKITRLAEAYVFRRAVCNIPTNSLNKTFSTFSKAIDKNNYLESVEAHLLLLPSYRRFPLDEEFYDTFQKRDLYNFRSRTYWLRKFENYERKEPKFVNDYTIEHIMPQNENLSVEWRQALGSDWERVQKTWLHTLGNLTLTGYNSEYSDRPFVEKRDMNGGFKESPLLLNKELGAVETWNEEAIVRRAEQLAARAVQVWAFPTISKDTLKKYEPEKSIKTTYSIEDHQYLSGSSEMYGALTKDLFEAIRKEILALDPAVTEEFLKLYVAYKAEVNFVDIIPRAQGMILSINMKGEEIVDPRGLCKDVSQQGHWGNGAYEMKLEATEDIPYAMGLIRQALELQLGSE